MTWHSNGRCAECGARIMRTGPLVERCAACQGSRCACCGARTGLGDVCCDACRRGHAVAAISEPTP